MTQQIINTKPGTGDLLPVAFNKVNANFEDLYHIVNVIIEYLKLTKSMPSQDRNVVYLDATANLEKIRNDIRTYQTFSTASQQTWSTAVAPQTCSYFNISR